MATEKRLMCVDEFKKNLCHYCNTYMSEEPCEPSECWVHDVIAQTGSVDAVPVDDIILHHILIDNEGVPEVKLQIGDRYFILRGDPVDVRQVVHGRWIEEIIYDRIICDVCGHEWNVLDNDTETFNYCPNCGADMRERKDNGE